jgi:hypothetical protein
MDSIMKDLLLIQSFDLVDLMERYRIFFVGLLPSVFILAVLVEYFDRVEPFLLLKRAVISALLLASVSSFYFRAIDTSMEAADEVLMSYQAKNLLVTDLFTHLNIKEELRDKEKKFFDGESKLKNTMSFLKYHLFDSFINDTFTIVIYFLTKLCLLILKVVYSLVYYLGYGLIGIPCLLYLFPSMGNVLRGGILSFVWCLTVPHILVFIISLIGSEINKGYVAGQIIGGSMMGTTLLFILTLFLAFSPLIATMILSGSGISTAGGIIASMGANFVTSLPKNIVNSSATMLTGGKLGPKMSLASNVAKGGARKFSKISKNLNSNSDNSQNTHKKESYASLSKSNERDQKHQTSHTTHNSFRNSTESRNPNNRGTID